MNYQLKTIFLHPPEILSYTPRKCKVRPQIVDRRKEYASRHDSDQSREFVANSKQDSFKFIKQIPFTAHPFSIFVIRRPGKNN